MFGDDPFIVVLAGGQDDSATFSARDYAEERCRAICREHAQVPQAAAKEPGDSAALATTKPRITAFFVKKLKVGLSRAGNAIWWIAVVWIGIALVVQTIRVITGTADWEPRVGEPCGPGHRYVRVGIGLNSDLSCEPE
jgi:hypothetical protein